MIEALERTLALFVPREKPQLSPGLAASFIRKGRHIPVFRGVGVADGIGKAGIDALTGSELCLFLLAFRDKPPRRRGPAASDRNEPQAALAALNKAAHIRGTRIPAFRFVWERHNFATLFDAGPGQKTADIPNSAASPIANP
jgi:hypothetical protein